MINFITSNWGTLLGGGSLTGFLGWIFYGRKNQNAEFTAKVQGIYDNLVDDLKKDREFLKQENAQLKAERTIDKEYFRTEMDKSDKKISSLQEQFNNINLSYAKEVEVSQNWERLYHELSKKYDDLSNKYDAVLKKLKTLEKNQKNE
jgi:chromosome segregation ATPase